MADLSFDFVKKKTTLIDELCYYCEDVIDTDYVLIVFKDKVTMRICTNECWDKFVLGVAMINGDMIDAERRKSN
jgi:hypothetical protein